MTARKHGCNGRPERQDTVLDPFMGSGTVAKVAAETGRNWIGCELQTQYAPLQKARTAQAALAAQRSGCAGPNSEDRTMSNTQEPPAVGARLEPGVGRLEPERADLGPHLKKQARRLLGQLDANRPRRALDIDDARKLLEAIAAPCNTEQLLAELVRCAWEWGVSCEVDSVRWGEAGDSHSQMWRDRTADAATRLHAALLASGKTPNARDQRGEPA